MMFVSNARHARNVLCPQHCKIYAHYFELVMKTLPNSISVCRRKVTFIFVHIG